MEVMYFNYKIQMLIFYYYFITPKKTASYKKHFYVLKFVKST